jgi:hypothetical protein
MTKLLKAEGARTKDVNIIFTDLERRAVARLCAECRYAARRSSSVSAL